MEGQRTGGEPPPLDVVQRWFAAVMTHPNGVTEGAASPEAQALIRIDRDELRRVVTRSGRLSAEQRMNIYASAYYARLLECLGEVYPIVKRTLGVELFDEFAFEFLQRHPSRSYTLNRMGDEFPRFLQEVAEEGAGNGRSDWAVFLAELARMEWAIGEVFDGPGSEELQTIGLEEVRRVDPVRWPGARLRVSPCVKLLAFTFPINDFFTAARIAEGPEAPSIPRPAPSWLALNRREFIVRRHPLTQSAHGLLEALMAGACVEEAIHAAASTWPDGLDKLAERLHHWFEQWAGEGFFVSIEVSPVGK